MMNAICNKHSLDFQSVLRTVDKIIPRSVIIYMTDDADSILSNEETFIGDLTSDDPKERVFRVQFVLKTVTSSLLRKDIFVSSFTFQ